ncbi:armadillo-type protein [Auriculariales sp. MPI-PUGE-AT-0066]|nr:armadillo-type protein [Auriculariales sp. MPI-PUGE-AT-0066]
MVAFDKLVKACDQRGIQDGAKEILLDPTGLHGALRSHKRGLRLSALQLLVGPLFLSSDTSVLEHILSAEECTLDVAGVRGRTVRITKLPALLDAGSDGSIGFAVGWLTAQLKVNLRPIWDPTVKALSAVSQRWPEAVWGHLWGDLERLTENSGSITTEDRTSDDEHAERDQDALTEPTRESERTWRDPSLFAIDGLVRRWNSNGAWERQQVREAHTSRDRLDVANYEAQLLKALSEMPSLAEKHSRAFIPRFLVLVPSEGLSPEEDGIGRHKKPSHRITAYGARPCLSGWLTLLGKFVNPKAAFRSTELKDAYIALLAHPDRSLQDGALTALATYKDATLTRLEPRFRALLDETRWRDEAAALASQLPSTATDRLVLDSIAEHVLVRLSWGLMTERRAGAQKRAALLSMLGASGNNAVQALCDLMCAFAGSAATPGGLEAAGDAMEHHDLMVDLSAMPALVASEKQQMGFLVMLGDVLQTLGTHTVPSWDRLVWCTILCMHWAQRRIDSGSKAAFRGEHDKETADDENLEVEAPAESTQRDGESVVVATGATRAIRQTGFKRLVEFFRAPVLPSTFDFTPFLRFAFASFISPRLALFDRENTQASSALLQVFSAWASGTGEIGDELTPHTVFWLVNFDDRVLPKIFDLLSANGVTPKVVVKVLDIADRILELAAEDGEVAARVFIPHVNTLLHNLSALVAKASRAGTVNELAGRQITILSKTAKHVHDPQQAATLLSLVDLLLRRPARVVAEKVKADLLRVYGDLVPLVPALQDPENEMFGKTFDLFVGLFSALRTRAARVAAADALKALSSPNERLVRIADLVSDLNAFSTKRVEQYDFNRRLDAFRAINEVIWSDATPREWLPLLQNALYFIQDPEELSLRQNSAYTLRRFVERLSADGTIDWMASQLMQTFSRVVWPALKRGLRASTELVRSEVLGVIAFGIERCDKIPVLVEMRPLLADGDEEASFFANICHIQVHRRTRAIRRLAEYVQSGILSNAVLSQVFLPLLAHPIFTSGTTNHLLVNEAITTTGVVARHLTWGSYNGLVLQYQRAIKSPKEKDKVPIKPLVRTLVSILDNFHFPMDAALEKDAGYGHEDTDEEQEQADPAALKGDTRIMDAVVSKLLPALLHILETRDETEDALRIPVCVGIVRIALHLPAPQRTPQVSRLLTIIAQIFRSKSQDTRDLARETLCRVVVMLGPDSLQETMHQLRAALTRGPHLHILAYVAHSLLVHVTTHTDAADAFANLDNSVADIVHVAAEVVFGESGKDVQSEGFTTKLKEVKGSASRGLDTFSLAAKGISPAKLTALLLPIRKITEETESAKVMALVDDVLRRIASGLNANARLSAGDLLLVCHTLVSQNAKFLKQTQTPTAKKAKLHPDVEVSLKRTAEQARDHYGNNSHRFIALGLDVFVTAARRSRFDFQNEDTISRLEPMVPAIGNTLYSSQSGVLVVALKAAAAITKCPLKNVDRSLSVLLRQILDVIKQTGSTDSEVTQTALKTLAMVLRDKPASQVKEKDLTYLLELVGPDLEEHERQASVFAILRAIISRKFIVPEIYDIMDRVAVVMVTSQSPQVQELCRGVLLQFFLDYPQGKGRLQKQMNFLAKNLSYVYESGRKSAMELLRVILTKFDPALMDEFSNLFFVALVMVMSNDESTTCREMASELVKTLFQIMNEPKRIEIISMLQTWATQADKIQLSRVSIQILGVVADTLKDDATPFLPSVLSLLGALIAQQAALLQEAELDSMGHAHLEWQLPYQALTVLGKVLQGFPARALSSEVPWQAIISLLLFPHAWVRTGAARLLGSLFASQQPTQPNKRLPAEHPLSPSSLTETARKTCLQLSGDTLDSQLAVQVTKNLVYLGKCFAISASATTEHGMGQEDGSDETSDDDVEAQPTSQVPPPAGQLNWLFSRLSHQSRAAIVARRNRKTQADHWTEQPSSILKFFAAMSIYMDAALTTKFLVHMLAPVQRILDEDTIDDEPFDALKTLAAEVQDLVLKKVGTTAFTEVFSKLRNRSINVKRERKEARALMVATDPQRAAARKKQHDAVKKESKKRKNRDFREGRTGKIPVTKKQRLE